MKRLNLAPIRRRRARLIRILTFLVTLALILGAVYLVAHYDKLNFDGIRRWITYRSLERNDDGQAQSFTCAGGDTNRLTSVAGDLLACSGNTLRLYSGSGSIYIDESVTLANPAVDSAGSHALAYDVGGQLLYAVSDRSLAFRLEVEEDHPILSASVNEWGWIAVTAQRSGYVGSVAVYNPSWTEVMRSGLKTFIMDAVVSPDCKHVAILTAGLSGGNFESAVAVNPTEGGREDGVPEASCLVGNNVILDLRWTNSGIWCLGENGASLVSPEGVLLASCGYGGRYLKAFSLEGDGFAVMLLGKYRAGTSAVLTVMDSEGELITLPVEEQVLSLSAAGRYIAVLTADRLDIYTQDLTLYDTLEGTQSARSVVLRADGTAMLISGTEARLYIPD